jgi:hypothetical protein
MLRPARSHEPAQGGVRRGLGIAARLAEKRRRRVLRGHRRREGRKDRGGGE